MSDAEKDPPEPPRGAQPEAKSSRGAEVISIEQARNELLKRPRQRATPPRGVDGPPRARRQEVPAPVTMPPGQHSSVIVTDTPAARAHIDKKTVHPGEAPLHTHDKKVRLKTSLDPRRQKTQITDRKADAQSPDEVASPDEESEARARLDTPSQPPPPRTSSIPPRSTLARGRPLPRADRQSGTLFVVGVILAAALGAAVVYIFSRAGTAKPGGAGS